MPQTQPLGGAKSSFTKVFGLQKNIHFGVYFRKPLKISIFS